MKVILAGALALALFVLSGASNLMAADPDSGGTSQNLITMNFQERRYSRPGQIHQ